MRVFATVVVSALLLMVTSVLFLTWGEHLALILAVALTAFSCSVVSAAVVWGHEYIASLDSLELTLTAAFAALLYVANFFAMLLPSFIYYVIPFAAGISFYLPGGVIFGAFRGLCRRRGSAFVMLSCYGAISEILAPNVFWIPYYLAWGACVEFCLEEKPSTTDGFIFGLAGAALACDYMLVAWGYYRPLFIVLPAVVGDALLSALGFVVGLKMSEELRSLLG